MGWFPKNLVESISPKWALRREVARSNLKMYRKMAADFHNQQRSFDAIDGSRLRAGLKMAPGSVDSEIYNSIESLRNHVRQQEFNDGNIAGPIERWTNYVVGPGLRFQSRVKPDKKGVRLGGYGRISETTAEEFNFWAEKKFRSWQRKADQKLQLSFYRMMWVAEAARMRDGEALIIIRKSDRWDREIPTCLDVLEIDRLRTPPELMGDQNVRNGIRFDAEGAPLSYYISKTHPGDVQLISKKIWDFEEVPAWNPNGSKKVIHLFKTIRPEQTRGYSRFSSALASLSTVGRYKEAELFAALGDACYFGYVANKNPATCQSNNTVADATNTASTKRVTEWAPGKILYGQTGEEMTIHKPTRPNEKFDEIVKSFLRDSANGLNMPLEVFLQDWKDINYSNARTILLQLYIPVFLAQNYLMDALCEPVWENVCADLVALGKLRAPGFLERKEDYLESAWITPKRDWVDPRNETEAKKNELDMGVTSEGEICASMGKDFDDVIEERARNLRKKKEIEQRDGIKFETFNKNQNVPASGQAQDDDKKVKPKLKAVK